MFYISRALKIINAFSIDIAFGAVFSSRLLYFVIGTKPSPTLDVILGITVWLIYTLDHLIDARSIKDEAQSFRHRLHQLYFTPIFIIWVMILCLNAFLTLIYLAPELLLPGVSLLIFVIVHHLLNRFYPGQFLLFGKEVRIATGYVLGLSLGPVALSPQLDLSFFLVLISLFCLAMINLLFFALNEKEADKIDALPGIAQYYDRPAIRRIIDRLALVCLFIVLILAFYKPVREVVLCSMLILTMLVAIVLSVRHFDKLKKEEVYRFLGDGIFLIPALLWV